MEFTSLDLLIKQSPLESRGSSGEEKVCGPWCKHYTWEYVAVEGGICEIDDTEVRYKQACHHTKINQRPIYQLKK